LGAEHALALQPKFWRQVDGFAKAPLKGSFAHDRNRCQASYIGGLSQSQPSWRRGVVLSFASALLQAATAVAIVAIAAVLIGATAKMMGDTVRVIEVVSYAPSCLSARGSFG
jgi:hypothetical protein